MALHRQRNYLALWSEDKITVHALISSILEWFHAGIMMARLVGKNTLSYSSAPGHIESQDYDGHIL